jgi:transcriptional regulator with XRE-family HTH domain
MSPSRSAGAGHGSGGHGDVAEVVGRAVGEELRRAREARGWSRAQLVAQLPSGIGDRTLLSYEHGTRNLTMARFIELCHVLREDPAKLLNRALQRARINLDSLVIRVDLRALLKDGSDTFRPMHQWARNTLNEHPDGTVELAPVVVQNLASFVGCPWQALSSYLARFVPNQHNTEGNSSHPK